MVRNIFRDSPFTKDGRWDPVGGELFLESGIGEPLFDDKEPLDREIFDLAAWSQQARESGMPTETHSAELIRRISEIRESRQQSDPTTQDVLVIGENQTVTLRRPDGTETPFLPSFDIED